MWVLLLPTKPRPEPEASFSLQDPEVLTYFFLDLGQEGGADGGGGGGRGGAGTLLLPSFRGRPRGLLSFTLRAAVAALAN